VHSNSGNDIALAEKYRQAVVSKEIQVRSDGETVPKFEARLDVMGHN
jgi:hypothetical protein